MQTLRHLEYKIQQLEKLLNVLLAKNLVTFLSFISFIILHISCNLCYITSNVNIFVIDGTSAGDGTTIGKCPSGHSSYKCLSNGACNVCGLISGNAEGCDITSTTPVCDADSTTSGIQDSASGKVAQCVACKKNGKLVKT